MEAGGQRDDARRALKVKSCQPEEPAEMSSGNEGQKAIPGRTQMEGGHYHGTAYERC